MARVKQELNELQGYLANGRYDERDNRPSPRDRDVLTDDLRRLSEYREHHEGWGL